MTPRKTSKGLKVVQAADPVPAHLSERSKALWREVEKSFVLEANELELLRLACEALDRCEEAREVLARDGLFTTNRANRPVAHPGVAVERDSRLAAVRVLRELGLENATELQGRWPLDGGGADGPPSRSRNLPVSHYGPDDGRPGRPLARRARPLGTLAQTGAGS
jgi:P27 family predicted phage terminase small subunit